MTSLRIYFICLITFEAWLCLNQINTKGKATIPCLVAFIATILLVVQLKLDNVL